MRRSLVDLIAAAPDAIVVTGWFLLTRLIVVVSAFFGAAHLNPSYYFQPLGGAASPVWLDPFVRWDAAFYIDLARNGYPPAHSGGSVFHAAFFPLYPLLVRLVERLISDTVIASILLSNVFAWAAALLVCRLGRVASGGSGRIAAMLWLASPGANFLSYPYSESLFCLLVAAGFLAVLEHRPAQAVLWGALASATRPVGVVVAFALMARAWERRADAKDALKHVLAAGGASGGLAAFALFCRAHFGDALYFSHIQSAWGRHLSIVGPLRALLAFQFDPDYYFVTLVAIVAAVWMIRRASPVMTSGAWFLLLVPLFTGSLKSMIRFQSANIPLVSAVGPRLSPRALRLLLAVCLLLLAYQTYEYSAGYGHN